jgi:hypothetical protein
MTTYTARRRALTIRRSDDQTIRDEVDEYNRRFAGIPGFTKLNPNLFKAQLLTETGPANPQWLTFPAQIGKPGNEAYGVLKRNE